MTPIPTLTEKDKARFWINAQKSGDCWMWTGKTLKGYGSFSIRSAFYSAHRVAYTIVVGPIPEGMGVLHRCDQPLCVCPDHLFLGTHQDNMRDAAAKGRMRGRFGVLTCRRGHALTPDNVGWRTHKSGHQRICKRCREEYQAAYSLRVQLAKIPKETLV